MFSLVLLPEEVAVSLSLSVSSVTLARTDTDMNFIYNKTTDVGRNCETFSTSFSPSPLFSPSTESRGPQKKKTDITKR